MILVGKVIVGNILFVNSVSIYDLHFVLSD